jgi:microcystin-dependent protein
MSKTKHACISTLALAAAAGFAIALPGGATAQIDYFIGEVKPFGFSFCPRDWVPADGGVYAIGQFSAAFSIMYDLYGGNGTSTFGVPDLRGRALAHNGQGPGLSYMPVASWGGVATGQVFSANLPPHTHALRGASSNGVNDHDPAGRTFRNFGNGSA